MPSASTSQLPMLKDDEVPCHASSSTLDEEHIAENEKQTNGAEETISAKRKGKKPVRGKL
jgi:hypothetical protein